MMCRIVSIPALTQFIFTTIQAITRYHYYMHRCVEVNAYTLTFI